MVLANAQVMFITFRNVRFRCQIIDKRSFDRINTEYNHDEEARLRPDRAVWNKELSHPIANSFQLLAELDRGPTAIIIVGKEEVHFCMPMGLIFHYSAMADKTLNTGFSESGSNIIRLPEHEPDTFAIFKAWIYQGDIRVQEFCQGPEECPETRSLETLVNTCLQLCKLYILVDYLESRYRDDMSEEILVELRGVVCKTEYYQTVTPFLPEIALYVFRNTSAKSGLRAFIVENLDKTFWHKKKPHVNEYEKCIVEFPLEFAAQLIKSVINSSKMAGDAGME